MKISEIFVVVVAIAGTLYLIWAIFQAKAKQKKRDLYWKAESERRSAAKQKSREIIATHASEYLIKDNSGIIKGVDANATKAEEGRPVGEKPVQNQTVIGKGVSMEKHFYQQVVDSLTDLIDFKLKQANQEKTTSKTQNRLEI